MGENAVTRLIGVDWRKTITVHHCVTDALPMVLDLLAAKVPSAYLRRQEEALGIGDDK